jgi:hypothetical protein
MRAAAVPSILISLCCTGLVFSACDSKPTRDLEYLRRVQAKIAALPAQCILGNAKDPNQWIGADAAAPSSKSGLHPSFDFSFKTAVRTDAFHLTLNLQALQNLEMVETRNAEGAWSVVWTGTHSGALPNCEYMVVAQRFMSGEHEVSAMRVTLHAHEGRSEVSNAGLFKAT